MAAVSLVSPTSGQPQEKAQERPRRESRETQESMQETQEKVQARAQRAPGISRELRESAGQPQPPGIPH